MGRALPPASARSPPAQVEHEDLVAKRRSSGPPGGPMAGMASECAWSPATRSSGYGDPPSNCRRSRAVENHRSPNFSRSSRRRRGSGRNLRHIRKSFHPRGPPGGRCGTRNDGLPPRRVDHACAEPRQRLAQGLVLDAAREFSRRRHRPGRSEAAGACRTVRAQTARPCRGGRATQRQPRCALTSRDDGRGRVLGFQREGAVDSQHQDRRRRAHLVGIALGVPRGGHCNWIGRA